MFGHASISVEWLVPELILSVGVSSTGSSQEVAVADNKNPNEKQRGENNPGKYHYNPGNQAGKTAEKTITLESDPVNNRDRTESPNEKIGSR